MLKISTQFKNSKRNKADTGIEKETIAFYQASPNTEPKTVEIKFTLSGSAFKIQLPTFKQGNAEEFLHFLHEFFEAKNKLGRNTCPKLQSGLEQLIKGNARNKWTTIKNTVAPNTQTVASLNKRILAYKKIYIPDPSAIKIHKTYLQRVKKNDKLIVSQFLDHLKHINLLISQFPNAKDTNTFSNDEIKRIFYTSMPL